MTGTSASMSKFRRFVENIDGSTIDNKILQLSSRKIRIKPKVFE